MSETVDGRALRIHFDGAKCIHARQCVLTLPTVFKANVVGPWIDPDGAPPDEVVSIARRCPSGAIRVERLDGSAAESPSGRNVVAVLENGPYAVRGALTVAGEPAVRGTLCRCGASKNKPWCDHSHVEAGFVATGEPGSDAEVPAWSGEGGLDVVPLTHGPLKCSGPQEVTTGTGRTVRRADVTFLCRCGASSTKPFCDGTHRKIGFQAP